MASQLVVKATVEKVVDGDTFTAAAIPLGFGAGLVHVRVRVDSINAPENGTAEGDAATEYVKTLVQPGQVVTVTSPGRLGRLDNYGRVLGAVTFPDGTDWADTVVEAGHAQRYTVRSMAVQGPSSEEDDE